MANDLPPNVRILVVLARTLYETTFIESTGTRLQHLPEVCATAPGRVNLCGEHTDYTGGFVLPLAIGFSTVCYGRGGIVKSNYSGGAGTKCRIISTSGDLSIVEFTASPTSTPATGSDRWANYVQGVVLQYLPDLQSDETFVFDMAIAGDVPPGSGLSSSASLEVATAAFLEYIMETKKAGMAYSSYMGEMTKDVMAKERAVRCQRAENVFCNVPCGIMDQFVSSAGSKGNLLLIDCRSLEVRKVSPPEEAADNNMPVLVIANSNVKHDLGAGEYPIRVQQCKEATEALSSVNPLIKSLRDASMDDIDAATLSGKLSGVLLKRAKHVVSENARTVEAADAWEKGDWEVVGRLMNESHSSMKDDYETSCEEIDILQELAKNFDGVYGSRLTGGGFGGCTVTLVKKNKARELMYHLRREYKEKYDIIPSLFETTPGDGASAIIM